MNPNVIHKPVMLSESMSSLNVHSGADYLDATLGGGGHTLEMLKLSAPDGRVLSLDVDPAALARARERQDAYRDRWQIMECNFRNLRQAAEASGWKQFDGILFDLGVSSDELADPSKGLSFQIDGPLDMRLGPMANDDGLTAATIVNRWSESELRDLFQTYGEERHAALIARTMVKRRANQAFERTLDLAQAIKAAVPGAYARGRIHPATKAFQALRIAVNDELASLKIALRDAMDLLAPEGNLVVISFHSLEDRIVKRAFKEFQTNQKVAKPIKPSVQEIKQNPRARSAILRVVHKTPKQKQNKVCPAYSRSP